MTEALSEFTRTARRDIYAGLNAEEARWLVDYYYAVQDFRIQAQGETRAIDQEFDDGTFEIGPWIVKEMSAVEKEIQYGLAKYAEAQRTGRWALSVCGIGPVLASGLLAHIDIEKAPTVGHIWRFAGLDPTVKWEKKTKRPWNAKLKVLCWKIGDSFVKVSGRESDVYGKVYRERKALEVERNEAALFADQAAASLAEKNIRDKKLKETYEAGRLPDGRIDLRARRYAVKLFLSHYHHVAFECAYGKEPPKPYILTRPEHAHFVGPPGWPID